MSAYMRIKLWSLLACLASLTGPLAQGAEQHLYGNMAAMAPDGWMPTPLSTPGATLVTFQDKNDTAKPAPTLIWLESTPLADVTPTDLLNSVLESSGLRRVRTIRERGGVSHIERTIDAESSSGPVRGSFRAYRRANKLYLIGHIADPLRFEQMGGPTLALKVFNDDKPLAEARNRSKTDVPPPATVLARAGQFQLTQNTVSDVLALAEFLVARPIDEKEKDQLRQALIDEFPAMTQEDYDSIDQISELLALVQDLGPTKRAVLRRDMMTRIWFDNLESKEESPLIDLIFKHNPVLGYDQRLNLVATRVGLNALLESNSFVAARANLKPVTPADRRRAEAQLKNEYDSLTEKEKRYVADGEVNWLKVVTVWPGWNQAEQNKHLGIVGVSNIDSPDEVPLVARNLEHWAGIDILSQMNLKMVAGQGDMMVLEHFRGLLGE